jgi:hypothetical protein
VVQSVLDVTWNGDVHNVHDRLDVLTHVVGQHRHVVGSLAGQGVVPHHVGAAEEGLDPSGEVVLPPFLREETHGLAEGVLRDDVGREAVEGVFDVEGLLAGPAQHLVDRHVRELVDFALELEHLLTREEFGQCALARSVQFMVDGREAGDRYRASAAGVQLMLPFVADTAWTSVDLVGEVRVGAVQFVGVDSHNGSWMAIRLRFLSKRAYATCGKSLHVRMRFAATLCMCRWDMQ